MLILAQASSRKCVACTSFKNNFNYSYTIYWVPSRWSLECNFPSTANWLRLEGRSVN
jgi:hypothetical protein